MTSIISDFSVTGVGDGDFYWDTDRFKLDNGVGYNYFDPTYSHFGDSLNYDGVDSLVGHTLTITQASGTGYAGETQFTHISLITDGPVYGDLISFDDLTATAGPLLDDIIGILFIVFEPADSLHYTTAEVTAIEKDELTPPTPDCPCPAWNNYNGTDEICI